MSYRLTHSTNKTVVLFQFTLSNGVKNMRMHEFNYIIREKDVEEACAYVREAYDVKDLFSKSANANITRIIKYIEEMHGKSYEELGNINDQNVNYWSARKIADVIGLTPGVLYKQLMFKKQSKSSRTARDVDRFFNWTPLSEYGEIKLYVDTDTLKNKSITFKVIINTTDYKSIGLVWLSTLDVPDAVARISKILELKQGNK